MSLRQFSRPPASSTSTLASRGKARPTRPAAALSLAAILVALVSTAALQSAPGDDAETLRLAMVKAADRLVALQTSEGTWPAGVRGSGDAATCGRPARALLTAWRATGDARYLSAAARTGRYLEECVRPGVRSASTANLLFLAELGRATRRADLVQRAADLRRQQLVQRGTLDGVAAGHELSGRVNRTKWMDGAWRNYLLWHGGEVSDLARAVGDEAWADSFTLTLASSWAPKHDYSWWTMGAGRTLQGLSRVPGEEARRLASAEMAVLLNNQLLPGLPWNDTPYDSYVYSLESAASLQGLLASSDREARRLAREGAAWLAFQQLPEGGWATQLSLSEGSAREDLATDESPEVDAEVLLTLAAALDSLAADRAAEHAEPARALATYVGAPLPAAG